MSDFDYDLFVIGGGSGGVRAARVAAGEAGAKVALAEEDRYGGTCVIRGCVPKKLMVFASSYSGLPDEAAAYGWDMSLGAFSWDRFSARACAARPTSDSLPARVAIVPSRAPPNNVRTISSTTQSNAFTCNDNHPWCH